MKKYLTLVATVATVATLHLQALYQSNPSMPEIIDKSFFLPSDLFMGLRIGYQHDQVFNRNLKTEGKVGGQVSKFSQLYDQGVLTLNFMDRVDLFGSAGAMSIFIADHQKFEDFAYQANFQSKYQFTWGAGLRVAIINWKDTVLGASANFQYANPDMEWNTIEGMTAPDKGGIRFAEWQVGVAVSQHIDIFIPYIGVNYSKAFSSAHGLAIREEVFVPGYPKKVRMRSRHPFGMVLGCDLSTEKYFDLGLEMQLISEQAFTIKADIRF
jgi:hypothetical protein